MTGLILLYYALCHSVGVAALVVSLMAPRFLPGIRDRRFALLAASLALILLPFSVLSYLGSRVDLPAILRSGLWMVSLSGESLMIAALPRFIHAFFSSRIEKPVLRAWTIAAFTAFASFPLSLALGGNETLLLVPMALMPASIVYAIGVSLRRRIAAAGGARWGGILRGITLASAAFLPILVVLDFFPRLLPFLGLPPYLKAFPLLYAVISLVYLRGTLPFLGGSRGGDRAPVQGAQAYGLSLREEEVAGLLLSGLSYREIGERLFISLSTVKTHVERVYRKTGAKNKLQLARLLLFTGDRVGDEA